MLLFAPPQFVEMRSLKAHRYGGREIPEGDTFTAEARHVVFLHLSKRAEPVQSKRKRKGS